MGEESKKKVDICLCVTGSLCYTPETNTTLWINSTPRKIKEDKSSQRTTVELSSDTAKQNKTVLVLKIGRSVIWNLKELFSWV